MDDRPHDGLIRLLAPLLDTLNRRQAFVVSAFGLTSPLIARLNFDQAAHDFTLHLCKTISPDTAKLDAMLDEAKRQLGEDRAAELEGLRPALHAWLVGGADAEDVPKVRVFLSYARADDDPDYDDPAKSFTRWLYNGLRDAGFNPWWDRESLPSRGLAFTAEIEAGIRSCQRVVLVVGPGASASEYVRKEWECALKHCLPVTPILVAGDYSLIPEPLRNENAIDFRPPRDKGAALKDLVKRLHDPAEIAPMHLVPELPAGHIVREEAFQAARDALCGDAIAPDAVVMSARARATALYGVGGVGKSTLASALAQDCRVRRTFHDGIIWLEIGQYPNVQARQADLGAVVDVPRERFTAVDERSADFEFQRALQGKTVLVVLDDVWDFQVVKHFPVGNTACRLLITTRSPQLAARIEGADIRLDRLSPDEGARLMAARTGGDPDDPFYRQIAEMLGGHTLAIRLAADQLARHHADSPADLLRLLKKGSSPFAHLAIKEEDKNENLERSLALSYSQLSPDLQRRFRALGVFAVEGTFDRDALAAVWGDADPDDARGPLATILGEGLIDTADRDAGVARAPRFSQHRLLRAYARAALMREGEYAAVFARYADRVIMEAGQFEEQLPEAWGEFEPDLTPHLMEVGDVLAARWAEMGGSDEPMGERALQFALNTVRFLSLRREVQRPGWLEMGRAIARQRTDEKREARFLNELGRFWSDLGEKHKALEHFEQALSLNRAVGDRGGEAGMLSNIGRVWSALGEKHKALSQCSKEING